MNKVYAVIRTWGERLSRDEYLDVDKNVIAICDSFEAINKIVRSSYNDILNSEYSYGVSKLKISTGDNYETYNASFEFISRECDEYKMTYYLREVELNKKLVYYL